MCCICICICITVRILSKKMTAEEYYTCARASLESYCIQPFLYHCYFLFSLMEYGRMFSLFYNQMKRNETKRNETKRNETKRNETKWNKTSSTCNNMLLVHLRYPRFLNPRERWWHNLAPVSWESRWVMIGRSRRRRRRRPSISISI